MADDGLTGAHIVDALHKILNMYRLGFFMFFSVFISPRLVLVVALGFYAFILSSCPKER